VAQPSGEFAVFQQEADQASELLGVFWGGVELMLELEKSVSILELSSTSCYSFAGLRLQPLFDCITPTAAATAVAGGQRLLLGWRCVVQQPSRRLIATCCRRSRAGSRLAPDCWRLDGPD